MNNGVSTPGIQKRKLLASRPHHHHLAPISKRWHFSTALQLIGLALMIGGMLALGAFTAPVVFKNFPRPEAAAAMSVIFRRYDLVLLGALGLVWIGEIFRNTVRIFALTPIFLTRLIILGLLTGGIWVSTSVLNPQIEKLNHDGIVRDTTTAAGRDFDRAHKISESIYKVDLLLAVLLIFLTPIAVPRSKADAMAAESLHDPVHEMP